MKTKQKKEDKPLRHGYTTGSCAAAATKAALTALLEQKPQQQSTILLPIGERVTFQLEQCSYTNDSALAGIIKDGGDDPDATHGALILSEVHWSQQQGIDIDGGVGVGRVTKAGLPIDIGQAAINPIPRKMIREAAEEVLKAYGKQDQGIRVIISVPNGEEIAKKTLNSRLGIQGGISILGTRGTVVPFSTAAFKASIAQAVKVAVVSGATHLILSTGGRSEKYGMQMYPNYAQESFIEMGDFVGSALKICAKHPQVQKVTLVGMMGKFSKLAQGVMMVHSKSAPVDFGFLAQIAKDAGANEEDQQWIADANTASQVGEYMQQKGMTRFFELLCESCCRHGLAEMKRSIAIETVLITLKGDCLGRMELHG